MSRRYSQDFKDRAVRLVEDRLAGDRSVSQWQVVKEIAWSVGATSEEEATTIFTKRMEEGWTFRKVLASPDPGSDVIAACCSALAKFLFTR